MPWSFMRSDSVLLMDILLSAQNILEFTANLSEEDFGASKLVQSAVLREIQVIGEAARQVSPAGQEQHTQIEWRKIAGMRNRIIHAYFDVRLDVVWDVVQNDIPALIAHLVRVFPPDVSDGYDKTEAP
ncbi:MAG: DUF86 domain-containing protein [bacterium]|nr:DUF86 domain-containing protein [bacterium]